MLAHAGNKGRLRITRSGAAKNKRLLPVPAGAVAAGALMPFTMLGTAWAGALARRRQEARLASAGLPRRSPPAAPPGGARQNSRRLPASRDPRLGGAAVESSETVDPLPGVLPASPTTL